jgi:hypothetical protein
VNSLALWLGKPLFTYRTIAQNVFAATWRLEICFCLGLFIFELLILNPTHLAIASFGFRKSLRQLYA